MAIATSVAVEGSRIFAGQRKEQNWVEEDHQHYKSLYAKKGKSAEEGVQNYKGFVEAFKYWTEVLQSWPAAVASKVALIVKQKADGTMKLCFVIDLRRPGINGSIAINNFNKPILSNG